MIDGTPTTAFGKYQLFASLGRGGMADVFLAVARGQMGFHRLAVIKRLRQALAEEAAFRNMFLDEARLAARLNHPNIVHTYEVGEHNGIYFIAMEYLEGQSLNKVLKEALRRKDALEPEICVRIIADALAGLGHAHELRDYDGRPLSIIHRDVSPHNIFVTYDGHTKLVDFGIAKAALSSTETEVGVLKGKVAYMSPEQAMGSRIDARSDLFAMGIVLWELIARHRLMTGESAANTLHKLMNEPIPRLASVVPGIDPVLDSICARALEKEPALRWQSASEMRQALEAWLATRPRPSRQDDVGHTMQGLFGTVRDEVRRQIERHMAGISTTSGNTEVQGLTAESLRRMQQSADVSGQLLRLNGSGSGSGVVPSYGHGTLPPSSQYPGMPFPSQYPPPAPKSSALAIVLAVGFFVLAAMLIVVFGLRDHRRFDEARAAEQAPTPVAVSENTSATTAPAPTPTPVATVVSASPSTSPASRAAAVHGGAAPKNPPAKPSATASAPTEDPGFLTINVYPWAKISEGGKPLCTTPCNKVPLPPGSHTLQVENPDEGLKQTTTVVIKSGETKTHSLALK
ncbi:serine/threonine protein kinase [Labilithrix luteola]|uniref:Serine/threonine protein kinase n=1 Tax=Labilithrix luteola TaxID=1391654 RepID=A0A0K1QCM6_9BACT|nr:serine/threonine protein kinase [Labilithrix luteola]